LIVLFFITSPIATTTMARATYRNDPRRRFILHYDDLARDQQALGSQARQKTVGEAGQR
jgi:multisubunit Na+/H+ antiporter MnhG subunit